MKRNETQNDLRIALFVDAENLVRGADTMGLPIDIAPVLDKLKQHGSVQIRRSFGDLERNITNTRERENVRKMLHRNLVLIEDVPFLTRGKNTADIRLVVEALSLAFQYDDLECFAIVASDRDYVPLFTKLREMGRTTIGVAIDRENTHANFREACDIVIYYETLFDSPQPTSAMEEEGGQSHLLDSYFRVLCKSVSMLELQGRKALGANVIPVIRQLRSDFDLNLVGCSGFREFVQKAAAAGLVIAKWPEGAGDVQVTLPETQVAPVRAPLRKSGSPPRTPEEMARAFREIVESKSRVPMLTCDMRRRVLDAMAARFSTLAEQSGVTLRVWSEETYRGAFRTHETLEQESIFKIGLALYFARCFQCRQTGEPYNPLILGIARDPSEWGDQLNRHLLRTVQSDRPPIPLEPKAVSLFLFDTTARLDEAERLIDEVCNG